MFCNLWALSAENYPEDDPRSQLILLQRNFYSVKGSITIHLRFELNLHNYLPRISKYPTWWIFFVYLAILCSENLVLRIIRRRRGGVSAHILSDMIFVTWYLGKVFLELCFWKIFVEDISKIWHSKPSIYLSNQPNSREFHQTFTLPMDFLNNTVAPCLALRPLQVFDRKDAKKSFLKIYESHLPAD